MNTNDHIYDLSKEIHEKNGVAIPREDPIMIQETINQRWVRISTAAHQKQLDHFKSEMETLSARWENDTKNRAERILNASLAASKKAMDQILIDGGKEIVASLREIYNEANKEAHKGINTATKNLHTIAMFNFFASFMTVLAAAILLWVTIK